ncbi:hypothetical protein TWF225_010119 [Orbilia oligospora]|nr:hypothetical protein TWF751_001485 [Orbilia oligospora]KAF3193360.1 hypothetical protein TWF225_010119 [Orbilia oligospora]KAF3241344.1 hypothetical protein TWF128_011058 [Orbilia oligospora]KAF3244301.1 hypothetical protein TWF217_010802 [Orbilia oligospora]KAF3296333.1 hypothetical protein TWF132_010931 [Orbilia oligospora]
MRPFAGCVLVILVSLFTAQAQDSVLPTCAQPCISVGLGQTSCPQLDVRCLCQSSGYISTVTTCVRSLCNESDRQRAFDYSKDTCSSVGIEVSIPGIGSTSLSTVRSATGAATPTSTNPNASSTSPGGSASRTRPPSSTTETSAGNQTGSDSADTSTPASNNSGSSAPVGAIVGGVVGGVVALVAVVILGTWLLKREQRKKMEMQLAAGNFPPKAPKQPDPNAQGIWEGNDAYSWNPQTNVHDVQGGVPNADGR